jgi:hypothetical protein
MGSGEFKLAKQVGHRGFYGHVILSAETNDNGGVVVEFDGNAAADWQTGARFGIEYVLQHLPNEPASPKALRVRVNMIHGMECDSSDSLIAYATAHALARALGLEEMKTMPRFDPDRGLVEFFK